MFGISFFNPESKQRIYQWYETKEDAIESALEEKRFYCDNLKSDTEWLTQDITFMVSYTYDEIVNYF